MSVLFFSVAGFGVKAGLSRRNSGTTVPRCKRQLSFRDVRIGDARQGQPQRQRHGPVIERGRCWRCSDLAPASLVASLVPVAQTHSRSSRQCAGIRDPASLRCVRLWTGAGADGTRWRMQLEAAQNRKTHASVPPSS